MLGFINKDLFSTNMRERVQKIIAQSGLCSRRKAEELIQQGVVSVNGVRITIGDKADAQTDTICVGDKPIILEEKVHYMLNKPKNYITTNDDMYKRNKVTDLVPKKPRVFGVGRLDRDASGLLILTNDGDFAQRILHPKHKIKRTYIAILKEPFNPKDLKKFKEGVLIDKRKVFANAVILEKNIIAITLHVGFHKVVKRLCKEIGYYVKHLHRTHMGNLAVDVEQGTYRELDKKDMKKIFEEPHITKQTFIQ